MKRIILTAAMLAFMSTAYAQVVYSPPDIGLFTQSHAATARMSFRDKDPLT